jgi:asparagine synthase (glutamine-hydrolysing)
MRETLRHRGPDAAGEWASEAPENPNGLHVWFGHRRLRIIDLSEAAAQPMRSIDGRIVLTYNGEVYNFRQLRAELIALGHRFRSSGDTEVVLRAYEAWGEACVERLDGMFALAIWDEARGRLLLARDRTGKKPLFYWTDGRRLAFASEIKALLACPWLRREVDVPRLAEYLTFGYVPHPNTLLAGIKQVPPAHWISFGAGGPGEPVRYWSALPPRQQLRHPGLDAAIRDTLARAVMRRLIADVPLGVLLSGGIDSSLVVGLMSHAVKEPVHTFSVGFGDDASFDERPYARRVATRFGTRHIEFEVKLDAVALMDRLLWHHDQPYMDSSALPTYLVCRLAHDYVTVVLNGDGGDEVFGGYDRFRAAAISFRAPAALAALGRGVASALPVDHSYYSPRRRAQRFLELAEAPMQERYLSWIAVAGREMLGALLRPEVVAAAADGVTWSMDKSYAQARALPALDRVLYANFCTYLPDDLAVKMDRMSMASSLEARSPFLDSALIELLARVPARRKVGLVRLKPLLRRAFAPLLPDEIWKRRKHGFGVPMGAWMRGELGTMFEDEVLAPAARVDALLNQDMIRRLYVEHRAGEREHGFRLWTVLTLEHWLRTLSAPPRLAPPSAPDLLDAAVS